MKKQNLVLIGFRGAGKKLFGKKIAELSHLPFTDIETEIEFLLDEPISDFIDKHGFQVFREIEQRVAHDFCRNFSGILATGAATIENSKNLQNLKKTGFFIFVKPDFSEVREFLLTDSNEKKRPRVNPNLSLIEEINQMWEQRKDIYAAIAETTVSPSLKGNVDEEAKKILEAVSPFLPKEVPSKKIAVFGSGDTATFQGIFDLQKRGRMPRAEISLLITDKKDSAFLTLAKKEKIKNVHISDKNSEDSDRVFINLLREASPDIILLLGWNYPLSPLYLDQFGSLTVRAIPSLTEKNVLSLEDSLQKTLDYEEKYTGATFVKLNAGADIGDTILQRKVPIDSYDTIQTLKKKILKQEILGFSEILEKR